MKTSFTCMGALRRFAVRKAVAMRCGWQRPILATISFYVSAVKQHNALVNVANAAGATTMLVNLEEPMNADDFDEIHLGKAGEILPAILEGLN